MALAGIKVLFIEGLYAFISCANKHKTLPTFDQEINLPRLSFSAGRLDHAKQHQ